MPPPLELALEIPLMTLPVMVASVTVRLPWLLMLIVTVPESLKIPPPDPTAELLEMVELVTVNVPVPAL